MSGLNAESQGDISFSDCVPGNILFIKKRSFVDPGHLHRSGLPGDWLCHPALVVGSIEPDQVLICPLTSFNSRSLQHRYPRQSHEWVKYFPVEPHEQVVRSRPQLRMDGAELNKPSYVSIDKIYTLHFSMLRAYDWDHPADHFRLVEEDLHLVLKAVKLGWRAFSTPTSSAPASPAAPFPEESPESAESTPDRIQCRPFLSEGSPLLPLYEPGTRQSTRTRIISRPSTPSIFRYGRNSHGIWSNRAFIAVLLFISYGCILYGGYLLGKRISQAL